MRRLFGYCALMLVPSQALAELDFANIAEHSNFVLGVAAVIIGLLGAGITAYHVRETNRRDREEQARAEAIQTHERRLVSVEEQIKAMDKRSTEGYAEHRLLWDEFKLVAADSQKAHALLHSKIDDIRTMHESTDKAVAAIEARCKAIHKED